MGSLTQRHTLDPSRPAASPGDAYNRLADEMAQQLATIMAQTNALSQQWQAEDHTLTELGGVPRYIGITCVACGAAKLEHFYTSKIFGRTLCVACFQPRLEAGQAREIIEENTCNG